MAFNNEDFAHFEVCIDRLNSAWNTFVLVKENAGHPLVGPAFRFALVEYATPYNRSDGINRKAHKLDAKYIPPASVDMHQRLLDSRNQVQAHADMTILDPKISFVELSGERLVTRSQNGIHGLEELPNIDQIIHLVEETLDRMYADRDRLKNALTP